ncbi:aspartyl/asparaginyl beta-hydroxylase domain-containing protein [Sphingomonas sp. SUN019]|uniref:aspartyl/asparaginyl beta-hydroxylase domain-containing protein n=1 Tax=Sphingomonas sp. SUN019 TaxID=2937788 RepID=UPI0021643F41|nr:aspartyl/asparaginyl beta-hydroxylase domain-containing protein [Sphingomonas sp. SUN019]UVO52269.1 aspartyl/asparaginyl beta-hydroxylase domain-containing protein [Sphingomonas sp. SUN019]
MSRDVGDRSARDIPPLAIKARGDDSARGLGYEKAMFETDPFVKLPLAFDADALAEEVRALPTRAWHPHPGKLPGNEAAFLVTTNGGLNEDLTGPMAPTEFLRASPYTMHVMAAIGAVWGRTRLMKLAPGSVVPPHVDTNFYWRRHIRIHVPIITTPQVSFTCRQQTVHMAPGECWMFDTFSHHNVRNDSAEARVHLVMDTVGGERLWDMVERAAAGEPAVAIPAGAGRAEDMAFEGLNDASVMSPWELAHHVRFIADHARPDPRLAMVLKRLDRFVAAWRGIWAQHGADAAGFADYRRLLQALDDDLPGLGGQQLLLRNQLPVYRQIAELIYTLDLPMTAAAPVRLAS